MPNGEYLLAYWRGVLPPFSGSSGLSSISGTFLEELNLHQHPYENFKFRS